MTFQEKILNYYETQGRDLPWRTTTDRYRILVSEIMLQQTQVDRVIQKYEEWLQAFPTPEALASAPLSEVLRLWSGLGYNNRAKRLRDAARIIVDEHQGVVPGSVEELQSLPGVGPYTARAVLIFADNQDLATVDTNIRRILIHELKLPESLSDKELFSIAEQVMPKGRSRDWHNALMDYGARLLTSRKSGIKPKTRQSSFKGSRRYYRGLIVKMLAQGTRYSLPDLQQAFPDCEHDLNDIVSELEQEGLIEKHADAYVIAG